MTPAFLFVMSRHDISDEKWAVIGPLLEKKKTETRGRKRKDDRLMFNGILWILKTGAPWRDLPAEFGPWNTVHKRCGDSRYKVCCSGAAGSKDDAGFPRCSGISVSSVGGTLFVSRQYVPDLIAVFIQRVV